MALPVISTPNVQKRTDGYNYAVYQVNWGQYNSPFGTPQSLTFSTLSQLWSQAHQFGPLEEIVVDNRLCRSPVLLQAADYSWELYVRPMCYVRAGLDPAMPGLIITAPFGNLLSDITKVTVSDRLTHALVIEPFPIGKFTALTGGINASGTINFLISSGGGLLTNFDLSLSLVSPSSQANLVLTLVNTNGDVMWQGAWSFASGAPAAPLLNLTSQRWPNAYPFYGSCNLTGTGTNIPTGSFIGFSGCFL